MRVGKIDESRMTNEKQRENIKSAKKWLTELGNSYYSKAPALRGIALVP